MEKKKPKSHTHTQRERTQITNFLGYASSCFYILRHTFLSFGLSLSLSLHVCLCLFDYPHSFGHSLPCLAFAMALDLDFVFLVHLFALASLPLFLSAFSPCSLMTRVGARLSFLCCSFGSMCACMCVSVCLCACIYEVGACGCGCLGLCCPLPILPMWVEALFRVHKRKDVFVSGALFLLQCRVDITCHFCAYIIFSCSLSLSSSPPFPLPLPRTWCSCLHFGLFSFSSTFPHSIIPFFLIPFLRHLVFFFSQLDPF
ncbi:MAG: hypothetical protein BYD32DRAFT_125728 [Podila humilis]|nr:MAG: hypothetical protein BYD32DRAFT_125728 [Podila humilis]